MLCHSIKHRSIRQYISCHWIGCHSIGPYFSCHWIGLHAIGSDFMPLDRTSCHWIGLHAIGSDFMPLDRTSCHWIKLHVIGSDFMSLDHIILLDQFHFIGALLSGQRFIIRNNISQNAFRHKVPRVQTGLKWFQLIP